MQTNSKKTEFTDLLMQNRRAEAARQCSKSPLQDYTVHVPSCMPPSLLNHNTMQWLHKLIV